MKFLLKGAECSRNKGTAAILKSTILTLKIFFERPSFVSISPHPADDKRNCKKIRFLSNSKLRVFKAYKDKNDFDCVLDLSGDTISDDYGKLTIFGLLYDLIIYKGLLRKPYVIYAQSLGPFSSILTKIIAKIAFSFIDLIIIRENITAQYLEKLGIKGFIIGADPAFLLPSAKEDTLIEILNNERIPTDKKLVGINMSQHCYDILGDKSNEYLNIHAQLIDHLIEELDVNVVLIPHVISEGFDDRSVSSLTYSKIKNKKHVNIIKGDYTPEEIKSIIGNCDLFIGARMHATIASTSMFVPTVGIAYSHKMHGIIGEMLNLQEYVIDLEKLNSEILIEKIMLAWKNREKITEHLRKKIPEIKQKALKNGKLLKKLCDSQLS